MDKRTVDLWAYLPPYLKNYLEFQSIIAAETPEFQTLVSDSVDALGDDFIETAQTEGVIKYEGILGITPDPGDTLEIRRQRILSRWNNNDPFTIKLLTEKIKIIQGDDDVSVYLDESDPFLLHVIIGYSAQNLMENIRDLIYETVPANIAFTIRSRMEDETDVYGIEIDTVGSQVTRLGAAVGMTGGSDFDSLSPWGGRYRCILADNGVELAAYGESGYSETGYLTEAITKNGNTYPIGTPVQVMVKQPKFYYYIVPMKTYLTSAGLGLQTQKLRCYVSPNEKDGFQLHPLFINEGAELDYVYLSAYEASIYDVSEEDYITDNSTVWDNTDKLSSIAGTIPANQESYLAFTPALTRALFRTMASNRGNGWHQAVTRSIAATQLLFCVEYGSCSAQTEIGDGNVSSSGPDATGATASLGNASGAVTNENDIQMVSYRGEENLWGNIEYYIDGIGIMKDENDVPRFYVCDDYEFEEYKTDDNYHILGYEAKNVGFTIQSFGYDANFDWLFLPTDGTNTVTVIPCTYAFSYTAGYNYCAKVSIGGNYRLGDKRGIFGTSLNGNMGYPYSGARLTYIPSVAAICGDNAICGQVICGYGNS